MSPFFTPRESRRLAKRFAFSSNCDHVISERKASSGPASTREYSFHVVWRASSSWGLISTRAVSFG